jgi:glycosyltransferase involved in cell wall biosynthesis
MKIGIDTFGCDHGRSGTGAYVAAIVKNLPKDSPHSFELFGAEIDRYTFDSEDRIHTFTGLHILDGITGDRLWHMFSLKRFVKKQKYDAVLYTASTRVLPMGCKVPSVAVVNEIVSNTLKEQGGFFGKYLLRKSLKQATMIIVASQFIRKDLVNLGIKPDKIEVIHNGIDHSLFYQHEIPEGDTVLIKPFSIKRPFLIYASRISSDKKKHKELIQAFSLFKEKTGLPHRLVLAGSDEANSESVHREASLSPYASDIFLTGYFPHQNLPELYSCADACIFPSVGEGVGLPIIEAMASGIPVACAKAGSLPEIAGDCALYFNPDDIEGFASSIELILKDEKLREKLIKSGLEWTKRFGWDKTVQKTIKVIESIVK